MGWKSQNSGNTKMEHWMVFDPTYLQNEEGGRNAQKKANLPGECQSPVLPIASFWTAR